MGQPGAYDVDTETWLYPQFAVLEAQLTDEPPRPPIAVRATLQGRIVLVIDAAVTRKA